MKKLMKHTETTVKRHLVNFLTLTFILALLVPSASAFGPHIPGGPIPPGRPDGGSERTNSFYRIFGSNEMNESQDQAMFNLDSQKLKPELNENPVIAKVISSQPIKEEYTAAKIENSVSSVEGNKKDRLFNPIIIQTSSLHQVDPAIVKAIIMAESGYNPRAISKAGAKGLMQLMPKTAQELGVEDVFNPQQNISGGVRYFKQLLNRFNGNFELALAAYNAGSTNVRRYKGVPPFKATQHYIKKVFKYYQLYKNQMTEEVDRT